MKKIDYKKEFKHLYNPSKKDVEIIEVPPMNYLMVDGRGDPNNSVEFQQAIEALFSVSYALKFIIKKSEIGVDYGVMPLEGLWWSDDMGVFNRDEKDKWQWTLMIMQPDLVTGELYEIACREISKKKEIAALKRLRYDSYFEGRVVQIMHIGLYSQEEPTIAALHAHIEAEGYIKSGKHHEIYLSDMRRANPKNLRTILRQPIKEG
ncbi:MAG: GyrI-like domain-containing protein [candidate division Zixibacteria bacterium]